MYRFGPSIAEPELWGIIPRACAHIFEHIRADTQGIEFTIKCSFLEIYKEVVNDLLNPKNQNLKVRETPARGVWVESLTEQVSPSTAGFDLVVHSMLPASKTCSN